MMKKQPKKRVSFASRSDYRLEEIIRIPGYTEDEYDIFVNSFIAKTTSTLYDDEEADNFTSIVWERNEIPALATNLKDR